MDNDEVLYTGKKETLSQTDSFINFLNILKTDTLLTTDVDDLRHSLVVFMACCEATSVELQKLLIEVFGMCESDVRFQVDLAKLEFDFID